MNISEDGPRLGAYRPGLFRLAGFGGALLMLRTGILKGPKVSLDVGFLTPDSYTWVMRRPMTPGLSGELSDFFFACASEFEPVLSVADEISGLRLRTESSSDARVTLEVEVEGEGLNFETSRVALAQAAADVRVLDAASWGEW